MKSNDSKRAFSLVELLVAVVIFLLILSSTYVSGISMIERFTDPRSDLIVSSEVDEAMAWLQSVITRALWTGSDFSLVFSNPEDVTLLKVRWETSRKLEEWSAGHIAFKSVDADNKEYFYSAKFQTLTPAISLRAYYGDTKKDRTDWIISISAYGFVRTYLKPQAKKTGNLPAPLLEQLANSACRNKNFRRQGAFIVHGTTRKPDQEIVC
jgi:prepilin-type N-terminal cleavage/methylation domain-containing protein